MARSTWFIGLLLIFMIACATSEKSARSEETKGADLQKDKDKYEVIVTDPGFERWFAIHAGGAQDHSEQYYKSWNIRYVNAWNYRVITGRRYSSVFNAVIDYDRYTNYGIDAERKLYYYFRWVETELRVPILDYRRPAGVL